MLRTAEFLVDFLKEPSIDQFITKSLRNTLAEGPRKLTDFRTLNGEIEIVHRKRASQFADNFDKFNDTYNEINNFIAQKVKSIQAKSHDLADELFAVGAEI